MKIKKWTLILCLLGYIISLSPLSFASVDTSTAPPPPPPPATADSTKELTIKPSNNVSQEKQINGNVKDQTGEPIIGAMVVENDNKSNGTVTDIDGNFSLKIPNNATITISYMGFISQEVNTSGKTNFNTILKEDITAAEEVVVIGFGTQKKVNVTGAVSTVKAEDFASRPVANVGQALQGMIAGLTFSVNEGADSGGSLDSNLAMNIRGAGTIGAGSNAAPLVLIDGIEGNMNTINPNDIESISVLKDAASSSIYGSRAAFGVILITTKKGQAGKTKINYTSNVRFLDPINLPNPLDSYRFAQYFNRASENSGGLPYSMFSEDAMNRMLQYQRSEITTTTVANTDGSGFWNGLASNANTNWFDEMYKSWVPSQEHNISISGGNEDVTYLVSGNFLDQNGLVRHGGDELQRYSLNARINAKLTKRLSMTYGSKWIRTKYDRPSFLTRSLFYNDIGRAFPNLPVYDNNGNYFWSGNTTIAIQMRDGGRNQTETDQTYNQLQFIFEPIKNWKIYAEGNIKTTNLSRHQNYLPIYAHDVAGDPYLVNFNNTYSAGKSSVREVSDKQTFLTTNIYTDYTRTFDDTHNFKAMIGFNSELLNQRDFWGEKHTLISADVPTLDTSTENATTGGGYGHWSTAGFFGRINYNYKERYLLEANVRYDGTSRFTGDRQWGVFPSVSAGYNIAREEFFLDSKLSEYINTFKIRGSWGQLGNTNTGSNWHPFYQTMPLGSQNGSWLVNGEKPNTSEAPGIVSAFMTWETVESWNIGFDFAALNNRLTGAFDYFNRKTLNMIGPAPELSSILGTTVPKVNNADMESFGFELEMGWQDKVGEVNYGVKLIFSDDQQRVTNYPNEKGLINTWYNNKMAGDIWGYETVGIAQSQEQMDKHIASLTEGGQNSIGTDWKAGDIMYKDINGDGKIGTGAGTLDDSGDKRIIGNTTPRYKYGVILNAAWRGVDLRIFFQGVGKRDFMLSGPYFWGAGQYGQYQSSGFEEHWDFFRPERDELGANLDAYYPRPLFRKSKNQQTQTRYMQDASYVRLKNLQLGYTLPRELTQKIKLGLVRIYVSADNLWTYSKLASMFDPETLGDGSTWLGNGKPYPLSQTISVGINVNF